LGQEHRTATFKKHYNYQGGKMTPEEMRWKAIDLFLHRFH